MLLRLLLANLQTIPAWLLPLPPAEGRLQLAGVEAEPGVSGDEVLALAAAAERNTRHPLADALVAAAEAKGGLGGC